MQTTTGDNPKRKPVNLTIREDVLEAATELNLNTSQAAEFGIAQAIRAAHAEAWLRENRPVLDAHNERVNTRGTLLTPSWSR